MSAESDDGADDRHRYPAPDASSAPTPGGAPPPGAIAGFWVRFLGALLDGLLLSAVVWLLTLPFGADAGSGRNTLQWIVGGVYFTYLHATPAGQTVGNRVVGVRIVDADGGGSIPYSRALIRYLMSIVSGIPLALGYLWMLWDQPLRQTWHDKVARTMVVRASWSPPPAPFGKSAA
ncbi:MAG: RDD family protein [Actinomycetota bacterium]|nr:RDD family protein [Actinomycetota bacterium]